MKRPSSKFQAPKHTQVPNDFFPMIPDMQESELKVTLIMIRETFGWHRLGFEMSINEMAAAAGLSRNGTKAGARAAQERGTFIRVNPDTSEEARWALNVEEPEPDPEPGPIPPDEDEQPDPGQPVTTPSTSDQVPGQPVTTPQVEPESKTAVPPLELNKELKKSGALASLKKDPRWNFETMGDYTDYPNDVWEHLIEFCVCFNFRAPTVPKKKGSLKEHSRAGLWITELRELKDACRPIGPIAIRYYRFEFERFMVEHDPHVGPHDVDKPGSIKNKIAGMVAKIQDGTYKPLTSSPLAAFNAGTYQPTPKRVNGQPDQAEPMVNKKF